MDLVQSNLLDSTRCIECGVDTQVMGFVNRVPYSGTDGLEAYVCGPCVSVWEERDIWRGAELIYCPMGDDDRPDIDWDNRDEVDGNVYELECDEYEKTHREQWFPEVDAKFPDAPAFREEIRRRNDA